MKARATIALLLLATMAAAPGQAEAGPHQTSPIRATEVAISVDVTHRSPLWDRATAVTYDLMPLNDPQWQADGVGPYRHGDPASEEGLFFGAQKLSAKAIYNSNDIAFLISWEDPERNDKADGVEDFSDAVSVAFDAEGMCHMGSMARVTNIWNIWYWRADESHVQNIVAAGVGTTTRTGETNISANAEWDDGWWHVVLHRSLTPANPDNQSDLTSGNSALRFARWDGGRKERNGTKWITASSKLILN